jgi:hypothetical protein
MPEVYKIAERPWAPFMFANTDSVLSSIIHHLLPSHHVTATRSLILKFWQNADMFLNLKHSDATLMVNLFFKMKFSQYRSLGIVLQRIDIG